jgi:hypothetical protein
MSPGVVQISTEVTQSEGKAMRAKIHKFTNCTWYKEQLQQ